MADSEVATGEALWRMWKVVNGKINQSMGEPCRGCVEESGILLPKLGGNGLIH